MENRKAVPIVLTVIGVIAALGSMVSAVYAGWAIGKTFLVLLVAAPFDSHGTSLKMLLAGLGALVLPVLLGVGALGLLFARRPWLAVPMSIVGAAIGFGVGTWIHGYFSNAHAADAHALGRTCTDFADCPPGYECFGTPRVCVIPCDDGGGCPPERPA